MGPVAQGSGQEGAGYGVAGFLLGGEQAAVGAAYVSPKGSSQSTFLS